MNNKERLPKLLDVYDESVVLGKRLLPLDVKLGLTLIMDVRNSGIITDNKLRGKELDDFTGKWGILPENVLKKALQVSKEEIMHVLNQNVPCVGCRNNVERFYSQLYEFDIQALEPLVLKKDGTVTIRDEKQGYNILGSLFQNHAIRLSTLIENQSKRNKRSVRCMMHSLEWQRSRPLSLVWRDAWDCMTPVCKKHVCIIRANELHITLETYLRKHRFCSECRTKVLKAYTLLVEEPEPAKEKGYIPSLYVGIKRCLVKKHVHLLATTDYITGLINRAEPELRGSRRERHAKTLEIAQEEVLTCLGIFIYEKLHRIYVRMREDECICQVFAAVAIHALSQNFETTVERVRGVTQLELLYAEFAREEQQKLIRKEAKKIKRKRKKGTKKCEEEAKKNCNENCDVCDEEKEEEEKDCATCKTEKSTCYNCELLDESASCSKLDIDNQCTNGVCECKNDLSKDSSKEKNATQLKCTNCITTNGDNFNDKKDTGSSNDHLHDCGYSSENNNGCCETNSLTSNSSNSAPECSKLACTSSCCNQEPETHCKVSYGGSAQQLTLQEMLEDNEDEDNIECYITPEEVKEFENNNREVFERRKELRETLQKRFAQFCVTGPLQVPRLLVQTKYASN